MTERQSIAILSSYLEHLLQRHGVLDTKGRLTIDERQDLPPELQDKLEDLIENLAELRGLLKIGRSAREGEPLSPTVLSAARLMAEEVCRALAEDDWLPRAVVH